MDDRIVEFSNMLRRSGVRISLSENMDAFHALEYLGIEDPALFRTALRATLVKQSVDIRTFEELLEGPDVHSGKAIRGHPDLRGALRPLFSWNGGVDQGVGSELDGPDGADAAAVPGSVGAASRSPRSPGRENLSAGARAARRRHGPGRAPPAPGSGGRREPGTGRGQDADYGLLQVGRPA